MPKPTCGRAAGGCGRSPAPAARLRRPGGSTEKTQKGRADRAAPLAAAWPSPSSRPAAPIGDRAGASGARGAAATDLVGPHHEEALGALDILRLDLAALEQLLERVDAIED
jgi:hypothetical protein